MKKFIIYFLPIAIAVLAITGFYFRNDIARILAGVDKNISDIKKINVGDIVNEIQKQVSAPEPIKINLNLKGYSLTQPGIISETNARRKDNGLSALSENQNLDNAAMAKAKDMFKNQYFAHNSPSGITPSGLVVQYGYDYIMTGENLILGNFASDKEAVDAWMNSPGHRENILNPKYTEIGAAVMKGTYEGQTVWIGVQEFGRPMALCARPDINLKEQVEFSKSVLETYGKELDAEKTEIQDMDFRSPDYQSQVALYNQLVEKYNSAADLLKQLITKYNEEVNAFNKCVE